MKNILLICAAALLFSCGGNSSSDSKNLSSEPYSVKENSYENTKATLIQLMMDKPYNPNGYKLESWAGQDEYGHDSWKTSLIVTVTEEQVKEMKKYANVFAYAESNKGEMLIDCMVSCFKQKKINCSCK
tara:strand:- start:165 stop:551 length:387 start_codon:yes stop_codon:yes gene_type:complete